MLPSICARLVCTLGGLDHRLHLALLALPAVLPGCAPGASPVTGQLAAEASCDGTVFKTDVVAAQTCPCASQRPGVGLSVLYHGRLPQQDLQLCTHSIRVTQSSCSQSVSDSVNAVA